MEEETQKVAEMTWTEIVNICSMILNYKLFDLDGYGISVAKVLTGIFLLIVGYIFSKRASREFDRRVLGRVQMEPSLRYTFSRLAFYVFFFFTTLFTLRALNVPITIFTVIGGALAVGIGFGSQNLVNNFISGILVMAERPIRIGDFIEIDGVMGVVQSIGIRSTVVRAASNAVIVIPNTSLIEKNLSNWSMADSIMCGVKVGVGYGTDMDALKGKIVKCVMEMSDVIKQPEPAILFRDFGDNALVIEVSFAIASYNMSVRGRIESDLRYRLNSLFVESKVAVPFPQRDVHLDVSQPLSVKVLS